MNLRDGFQRGIMDEGYCIVPGCWVPVDFTLNDQISYTFMERISSVGC